MSRVKLSKIPQIVERAMSDDPEVQLFVGRKRGKSNEDFILLFARNLLTALIEQPKLGRVDLLVLLAYAEASSYGNLLSMEQKVIAARIGSTASTVCRSVKKLIEAGLVYEGDNGGLYLNLSFLMKGSLAEVMNKYFDQMSESQSISEDKYGGLVGKIFNLD